MLGERLTRKFARHRTFLRRDAEVALPSLMNVEAAHPDANAWAMKHRRQGTASPLHCECFVSKNTCSFRKIIFAANNAFSQCILAAQICIIAAKIAYSQRSSH